MPKRTKQAKRMNRIQAHAKNTLHDQMFSGHQTREIFIEEVAERFKKECDQNGEIYTRTVKKEIEIDAIKHLASQVLGSVLQSSTKTLLSCLVDGEMVSEEQLWDCWLEVKHDKETILVRAAQADMMMVRAKVHAVRENYIKQGKATERWEAAEAKIEPYLKLGGLLGDAVRQLGLTFSEARSN